MITQLPRALLPSELLRLTVSDARALDRRDYTPTHYVWHQPLSGFNSLSKWKCEVNFAGCLMAGTLGLSPKETVTVNFDRFGKNGSKKLFAVNEFGDGHTFAYRRAFQWLGLDIPENTVNGLPEFSHISNEEFDYLTWREFDKFLGHIELLIEALEEKGL